MSENRRLILPQSFSIESEIEQPLCNKIKFLFIKSEGKQGSDCRGKNKADY